MSDDFFDQFGDAIRRFKGRRLSKRKKPMHIDREVDYIDGNRGDLDDYTYKINQEQMYINNGNDSLNKKWIQPKKRLL